jgi:hypothetical protein
MGAYEFTTPAILGDTDGDGDVDQSDYGRFQACLTGPGIPVTGPACHWARLDEDADVDAGDFVVFDLCMSGSGIPADPDCGRSDDR